MRVLLVVLALSACASPELECGPDTCSGCCDADGVCQFTCDGEGGGTATANGGGTATANGGGTATANGGGTATANGGGTTTANGGGTTTANGGGATTANGGGTTANGGGTTTANGGGTTTNGGGTEPIDAGTNGWRLSTIEDGGSAQPGSPAISIDPNDGVSVLYPNHANGNAREAKRTATQQSWTFDDKILSNAMGTSVGSVALIAGATTTFAVYSGNFPGLAITNQVFTHVYPTTGAQNGGFPNPSAANGGRVSTSATPLSSRGIAFTILDGTHQVAFAARTGNLNSWVTVPVASIGTAADAQASLAMDDTNTAHIAYVSALGGPRLMYARRTMNVWSSVLVDAVSTSHPSIALDAAGAVHIAYRDSTAADLKYARLDPGATAWTIVTLDATGSVGTSPSLAFGPTGTAHLSYFDTTQHQLKYLERSAAGVWSAPLVVATTTGTAQALAVDSHGRVHIAYLDGAALRYASRP